MGDVVLKAVNIKKNFAAHEVLKGVSMTARRGEVISILGSSGSGKSTFLRCMNLLERPTGGQIYINDQELRLVADGKGDLRAQDPEQLRQFRSHIAMVFQSFNLWSHLTVLENIIEAPICVLKRSKKEAIENAHELLQKVGLYDRRDYYPLHLSGGQQQRAAIARALAMSPDLMLFDEPTSALDPELVGEVLKVIRVLAEEGRTMILVTHEMSFAREVASEIVFLHKGEIEEQGTPEQVFNAPKSERFAQFIKGALKG